MSDKRTKWLQKKQAKARKAKRAEASELQRKKRRNKEISRLREEMIQRAVERDVREERLNSYIGPFESVYDGYPAEHYPAEHYPHYPYNSPFWCMAPKADKVDWKKEGF